MSNFKLTIAELIANATAAGRALLTAADATAQKLLLNLSKSDVGLGNVDNTSDANKPVSSAQAAAISARALQTITITAGTGLSGGGDLSANRTLALANTAVTPGSYTAANVTVDAQGRITAAANGSAATPGGSSGQVQFNSAGSFGGAAAVAYAATGTHLVVTAQSAAVVPICAKGAASQSGNLFECRNSADALRGHFTKDGILIVTFDTTVVSNGLLVTGSNGTTYATLGFGGIYGAGSWVGMDVSGTTGRVNIGAGQMHITHATGNRSRILTYGNLELSPGNLGGGGTYVEINNGTAGTYRDLFVRSVTQSSGSNLAPITKAALLLLTPNAATGGRWRVTDATPANREAYPDGTNWRYTSDDTVVT